MLLSTLWMLWAVLLWGLASIAVKRKQKKGGFELTPPQSTKENSTLHSCL